jgi:DNA-binding MarR family transcriptional regulator
LPAGSSNAQLPLQVDEGSLYPALYKLEDRGLIAAEWDITEYTRRAKFYRLTAAGKKQLRASHDTWACFATAMARVLETSPKPRRAYVATESSMASHSDSPTPNAARANTWRRYLRLWGARTIADVDDELQFHIEMRVQDFLARGMSEAEARAAASARLGDLATARSSCIAISTRREHRMRIVWLTSR